MKKFLLILFLGTLTYSFAAILPPSAHAQGSWQVKSRPEWEKTIEDCDKEGDPTLNADCYLGPYSLGSTLHTLLAITQGTSDRYLAGIPQIMTTLYATTLFSQPSSIDYLADVGQHLGLAKPAYAQGSGFQNFFPLLEIWKVFRDLAYGIFVIIFLVIGFMVMFRRKIDPQTVVGIQHALPKVIIALLLVTFSYAIVGFLTDIMLLLTSAIAIVLGGKFSILANNPTALTAIANASVFELIEPIMAIPAQLGAIVDQIIGELIQTGPLNKAISFITSISVQLIFSVSAVVAMIKTFFMLLESYVQIVISLIFGPLQLSFSAIPGTKTIQSWIMGLISNILVFPVTFALIFIAAIFLGQHGAPVHKSFKIDPELAWSGEQELRWVPPLLGGQLGGLTPEEARKRITDEKVPVEAEQIYTNIAGTLIAFGILFILPKIAEAIKAALQVKELPTGQAFREQLRAGAGWTPFVGGLAQKAIGS